MSLIAVNQRNTEDRDSTYMKLEVELYGMSLVGVSIKKQEISGPDYRSVQKYIEDKSYLSICDFDDHFEDVDNDWTNRGLFE